MTVIATASNPSFTVSRVDVDRPGPTYTIDTLRDLRTLRPDADLFFITGADALAQILSWKDIDELWSLAHFVGVTRPGHVLDGMGRTDVSLLEVPAMAISSTDCRARVAAGNPVWYLVPDGVVQYIAKYGLYDDPSDPVQGYALPYGNEGYAGSAAENSGNAAGVDAAGRNPVRYDPALEINQPASTE
jgi:nicotinate-nucleotide adenylyltransferase